MCETLMIVYDSLYCCQSRKISKSCSNIKLSQTVPNVKLVRDTLICSVMFEFHDPASKSSGVIMFTSTHTETHSLRDTDRQHTGVLNINIPGCCKAAIFSQCLKI